MVILPSMKSRWVDISQVRVCIFTDRDGIEDKARDPDSAILPARQDLVDLATDE